MLNTYLLNEQMDIINERTVGVSVMYCHNEAAERQSPSLGDKLLLILCHTNCREARWLCRLGDDVTAEGYHQKRWAGAGSPAPKPVPSQVLPGLSMKILCQAAVQDSQRAHTNTSLPVTRRASKMPINWAEPETSSTTTAKLQVAETGPVLLMGCI